MCITLAGRYVQIPQTFNNIHDAWPYQQFAWYTREEQRKGIESRKEWACSNSVDLVHCSRSKIQKWPDSHRFRILHKHFFLSLYVGIYMCFFSRLFYGKNSSPRTYAIYRNIIQFETNRPKWLNRVLFKRRLINV